MKELNVETAKKIEINVKKQQEQEYKHIGRYKPQIDGYKIFKFNKETREISLATYREDDTFVLGGANKKKLDLEKGHVYVEAINMKNAIKRLINGKIIINN